jgi:phosphoribosylamine--glycine ligase
MKVLVLGADGHAHTLVWKLFNSQSTEVICAPGNGGISQLVPLVDFHADQVHEIAAWCFEEQIELIVPASSTALYNGLVDEVISLHLGVLGPPQHSTRLARSRCAAKEFLLRHNLPTARGQSFSRFDMAEKYLASQALPVVLKPDLTTDASGTYKDRYAALKGLKEIFATRPLDGSSGVVIEEFLPGVRVSFSAFTDGRTAVPLLPVRLYEYNADGDTGSFAPGMGAHTSTSTYAHKLRDYLHQRLMLPILAALNHDNLPYWGILGIDCIITERGPRITTIRCSMKDMEAQVVLPRLEDDLVTVIQATISQRLSQLPPLTWSNEPSVGVAVVSEGYPHNFPVGSPLDGLTDIDQGVLVFHDQTHNPFGLTYTAMRGRDPLSKLLMGSGIPEKPTLTITGGHVLTVVARGATLQAARERAIANAERIRFSGRHYRRDIGTRDFS